MRHDLISSLRYLACVIRSSRLSLFETLEDAIEAQWCRLQNLNPRATSFDGISSIIACPSEVELHHPYLIPEHRILLITFLNSVKGPPCLPLLTPEPVLLGRRAKGSWRL
jgi:hypothetical protein